MYRPGFPELFSLIKKTSKARMLPLRGNHSRPEPNDRDKQRQIKAHFPELFRRLLRAARNLTRISVVCAANVYYSDLDSLEVSVDATEASSISSRLEFFPRRQR